MSLPGLFTSMFMSSGVNPPIYVGIGAFTKISSSVDGLGPHTLNLPSGVQNGDYLIVIYQVSSYDNSSSSLSTIVSISGSGTTPRTKIAGGFYSGTAPTITVLNTGAYLIGVCLAFRNVDPTTPIDASGSGSFTAVVGSGNTVPNSTSTTDNCYLLDIIAHNLSTTSTAVFSGWANTSLISTTELGEDSTTLQDDGGFAVAGGVKAVAGAINDTTFSLTSNSGNFRYLNILIRGK